MGRGGELCGDAVSRTAIDMNQFRFESIKEVTDENLLPGAVKFGGVPAFLALCASPAKYSRATTREPTAVN